MFRKLIFILIFLVVGLLPLWSFLGWVFEPKKKLNIVLIDKTVAFMERYEHRAFNWILTHYKYVKPDNSFYHPERDYYGFFPEEPFGSKRYSIRDFEQYTYPQIDSLSNIIDVIYTADTYGVYRNEWYWDSLITEHSPKVYGGMSPKEFYLFKKMKENNKLIISEFNTIASPTHDSVRLAFEHLFDIRWSGWSCRYFESLDTMRNAELPGWVVRMYKEQHGEWNFKKPGLVFVSSTGKLFILGDKKDLFIETPYIHTQAKFAQKYGLPDSVHYPFWLDIMYANDSNNIVSKYKLYPTHSGDSLLRKYGLPTEFPAVIRNCKEYSMYYLAGDFADNPIRGYAMYLKGITDLDFFFYSSEASLRTQFFWTFYIPLMNAILNEQYQKTISKKK